MSFFEKCRQTTVIVEDGSGVLFQPMTESYSYILTAKHNLYNDIDFGSYLYPKDLKDLNIVFYDGTVLNNELEEDVLAKFFLFIKEFMKLLFPTLLLPTSKNSLFLSF